MASFDDDDLIQLSFLRDEETDALINEGFLGEDARLSSPLDELVVLTYDELILSITTGLHYPVSTVKVDVSNISLPREDVDGLRRALADIATQAETTNNLDAWNRRHDSNAYGIFEPVLAVAELARETKRHIESYRRRQLSKKSSYTTFLADDGDSCLVNAEPKPPVQLHEMAYTTKELAYQLLKSTPSDIARLIPENFRVLHVEQVLRGDLASRFQLFQDSLRRLLSRSSLAELRRYLPRDKHSHRAEDMVEHLVQPRLTFHGTPRQNVPKIVRHGFSLPGQINPESAKEHEIRCGSTYGRGIYTSPSAEFSLSYSGYYCERTSPEHYPGLKLFVCATIMGRTKSVFRADEWRDNGRPLDGADSHVANEGYEYVVFDSAQVIPVYVVHLDWGAESSQYFANLPKDPAEWTLRRSTSKRLYRDRLQTSKMLPGDRQRAKEAIYARAAKYFPYGFGPATGTKFVVEDVGEVSEDEEDYGDYQALRALEADGGASKTEFWSWVKESEKEKETLREGAHGADEYSWERKALAVPRGFGRSAADWDGIGIEEDVPEESQLGILGL
ncbi:hypothetical protein B0I35DRAFT_439131 [Stachybotrys elegans]|uniref:PARP catalytic domain-containing protein n=1 Tax=Stachybotrys elegans TaxID=80388 RepID=A0A8K0SK20_9HYPO|nr:hypothetical protein B0I35DRAFT_439131 [Stachybotrys elegans]